MKCVNMLVLAAAFVLLSTPIAANEEKAARKAAALGRKMKLESCCLLISAYNTHNKDFTRLAEEHPDKNKKALMQKWQAARA